MALLNITQKVFALRGHTDEHNILNQFLMLRAHNSQDLFDWL